MFSFDLKSGYHHIEIASEYQTFLGFSWKFHKGEGCQYFVFSVLPFGLSTALCIFTCSKYHLGRSLLKFC